MASFWDKVLEFFGGGSQATGQAPAAPAGTAARPAVARPQPAAATARPGAPAARKADAPNPFAVSPELLGLSAEELRTRALKIDPYRTAWIGRVDTIPPASDERTALIDRGLVLRGLLTEAQLAEIHVVGDEWLKHHESLTLVKLAAQKSADAAIEALRAERKQRREERRAAAVERKRLRAEAIARRRAEEIGFLGAGVSSRLSDCRAQVEELERRGLPVLATSGDVARALELTVPRLRWLCWHAEAVERPHYAYFEVPKRTGGKRLLAAPQPVLAKAQRWVLERILAKLPVEAQAHGFVQARSTATNAAPHVGRDLVVNLDLKDYFPTIGFPRVRGIFQKLGYSPAVATILALLCTECPRQAVEFQGRRLWVAAGQRALPQGACTSPALSNQASRRLDRRLTGLCAKHGWSYTRYADDLTFSAPRGKREELALFLARVRHVIEAESFRLNPDKGRVLRAAGRQRVTGIVVNEKPSLPREEIRRLRAILHGAKRTGLGAQNREGLPHFEAWLRGKLAYLAMIDRPKGLAMLRQLDELVGRKAKETG